MLPPRVRPRRPPEFAGNRHPPPVKLANHVLPLLRGMSHLSPPRPASDFPHLGARAHRGCGRPRGGGRRFPQGCNPMRTWAHRLRWPFTVSVRAASASPRVPPAPAVSLRSRSQVPSPQMRRTIRRPSTPSTGRPRRPSSKCSNSAGCSVPPPADRRRPGRRLAGRERPQRPLRRLRRLSPRRPVRRSPSTTTATSRTISCSTATPSPPPGVVVIPDNFHYRSRPPRPGLRQLHRHAPHPRLRRTRIRSRRSTPPIGRPAPPPPTSLQALPASPPDAAPSPTNPGGTPNRPFGLPASPPPRTPWTL